jgi:hypothetical protein
MAQAASGPVCRQTGVPEPKKLTEWNWKLNVKGTSKNFKIKASPKREM